MNFRCCCLKVMETGARLLGRDCMKYRIARFRRGGARIGENVRAFSSISSAEPYLISIGNNVTIATGVKFITHDNSAIKVFEDATDFVGSIEVGDNVFVGAYSILLPGTSIADNCIVGAGSVVTKSFHEPGKVIAGNPAKVIGTVEDIVRKYRDNRFDFRNAKRRDMIENNRGKLLRK